MWLLQGQYDDLTENARFSIREAGFLLFSSPDITEMPGLHVRFVEFHVRQDSMLCTCVTVTGL